MSNFAGPAITDAQIIATSEVGKNRKCVSCGEKIPRGHICACQAPGAVNCPKCKKNITTPHCRAFVVAGASDGNMEVKIQCPRPKCGGYLYTYVYLEEFVAPPTP